MWFVVENILSLVMGLVIWDYPLLDINNNISPRTTASSATNVDHRVCNWVMILITRNA